jgi:hypothetical protein
MGTRFTKLLKILIKIGIMLLIMTGLILINRKYTLGGNEQAGIFSLPMNISIYTLPVSVGRLKFAILAGSGLYPELKRLGSINMIEPAMSLVWTWCEGRITDMNSR